MKRALVFGINGFVGAYLATELQSHGYEVVGSDVSGTPPTGLLFNHVNLLDANGVVSIVETVQPEVIINLAAISSVGRSWRVPQEVVRVNIVGALNILEAARALQNSPRVLLIGSSEEYEPSENPMDEQTPLNAGNPYGISKIAQERFASIYRERYGVHVYCVRAFNHTGIGQSNQFVLPNWCEQVAKISASGKPGTIEVGNLQVQRDFCDVRDIVRAYRMVLESNDCNTIYNVGSGNAVSLRELLLYIVSLSDQPVSVQVDPTLIRPLDAPLICCDHSLITERLGWEPVHILWDTVHEMFEFYLESACRQTTNG